MEPSRKLAWAPKTFQDEAVGPTYAGSGPELRTTENLTRALTPEGRRDQGWKSIQTRWKLCKAASYFSARALRWAYRRWAAIAPYVPLRILATSASGLR